MRNNNIRVYSTILLYYIHIIPHNIIVLSLTHINQFRANGVRWLMITICDMVHSFPFRLRNRTLGLGFWEISWITSRYRICIAAFESRIYEAYFIILAASTSACAEIIVASASLFCFATDDRLDSVSLSRYKSKWGKWYLWWRCFQCRDPMALLAPPHNLIVPWRFSLCSPKSPGEYVLHQ